jgi:UDP-glucose 4-epimerase
MIDHPREWQIPRASIGKILITGGAGFLGSFLIRALRRQGLKVLVADDGSAGTWGRLAEFKHDSGVRCHQIDVCDPNSLRAIWPQSGVIGVAHLAAQHFIPHCEQYPLDAWRVNVEGTKSLLTVAGERPLARLLLASTADVYTPSSTPFHESSHVGGPISLYGRSKLEAEAVFTDYAQKHGAEVVIARLFNMYGPQPTMPHLVASLVNQARTKKRLSVGNLTTVRDYVYGGDAARALVELLKSEEGVFNICTGAPTSGHRVVELLEQILGHNLEISTNPALLRESDRQVLVGSPARLCDMIGHWPMTNLELGLRAMLELSDT